MKCLYLRSSIFVTCLEYLQIKFCESLKKDFMTPQNQLAIQLLLVFFACLESAPQVVDTSQSREKTKNYDRDAVQRYMQSKQEERRLKLQEERLAQHKAQHERKKRLEVYVKKKTGRLKR